MTAAIIGLGTSLPASVTQEESLEHAAPLTCDNVRQKRILEELYKRTDIKSRSSVLISRDGSAKHTYKLYEPRTSANNLGPTTRQRMQSFEEKIGPLAAEAARKALSGALLSPDMVTHLITVSCTGFFAPGFDVGLINGLPLNPDVARSHLGFMGCHGALNGIRLASAIASSDPEARILICAAELCTLHFQYGWLADNLVANSLFADGAAALVVGTHSNTTGNAWTIRSSASTILPNSNEVMRWQIGDNGFTMVLSPKLPDLVFEHLPSWLNGWLAGCGLTVSDIASWAIHPGGPRILDAVADALSLSPELMSPSRQALSHYGNMSSPTVLFILENLRRDTEGSPCVMLVFGPGLAFEASLII